MKKQSCYIRSLVYFSPCQFLNFDALTCLTAFVLFNQSNNLNYSNKNYYWLILACFTRVQIHTNALPFVCFENKGNAWEHLRILYHNYKTNKKSSQIVLCSVVKDLGSGG